MRFLIPIFIAVLLGRDDLHKTAQPVARPAATTSSSTQAALKPIALYYGIYLARLDLRITVSPEGMLRSVRSDNKS
jgi:hypothetical protein